VDDGVESASVIDGRLAHSLLLETLTTAGIGTQVTADAPLPGAGS
jgi:acetylglutamate kinase